MANSSNSFSNPPYCEMTAVPGGIIEYARSESTLTTLRNFTSDANMSFQPKSVPALPSHVWIDALNRSIALSYKPLSRVYENEIRNFRSAYTPLAQFLRTDAFTYEETGNTCTTLFFEEGHSSKLVAFCSTKCSSLKIKGDKILSLCPSVEIAALCVDDRYRYMGIGHVIINHILKQIYKIRSLVGVQLITLFAVPDAVKFYEQFSFRKLSKGTEILHAPAHQKCIPMYLALNRIDIDK